MSDPRLWNDNVVTKQLSQPPTIKILHQLAHPGKRVLKFLKWQKPVPNIDRYTDWYFLFCDVSCSAAYTSNGQVATVSSYSQNIWFSYLIWLINVLITGRWNTLAHTSHSWYSIHVSTCRTLLACRLKFSECHFL